MKAKALLLIIGLFSVSLAIANQGGPDLFGYTWKDSNEPGGPAFHWVNIETIEHRVYGLADDNSRGPFSINTGIGDNFMFYWYPVDQLWIGSNGYIAFNNINLASIFPYIPDSTDNKNNFISALLTDLSFSGTGNPGACYIYVKTDSVIVSFVNVPFYSQVSPYWTGSNTFQIILDKTDYSITVNYLNQNGTAMTSTDVKGGMENLTGTIGLQPFVNTYPPAGYTIKYYYPTLYNYYVRDAGVRYNTAQYSRGLFLPYPSSFALKSMIANTGNLDIYPVFTAHGIVRDALGTNMVSNTFNFTDTLSFMQDSLVSFINPFIPTTAGTYSFSTKLTGVTGDAVSSNDSVVQELVVVDTSLASYDLRFCDNTPDLTGISWVDGTGGVGMYFLPPTYPVMLSNVQFYVLSNPTLVGCYLKIYKDNGPNGTPGTLLDSVYVASPAGAAWTTVTFTSQIIINNGGFYVGWEMGGLNITMGVDRTPPISHRTFEIISGAWAEYRDGLTQDFMIVCHMQKMQVQDVGATTFVHPHAGDNLTSPSPVACYIKNYGLVPETGFSVSYRHVFQNIVSQTYSGAAIQPGDSILFTFNTQLQNSINISGPLCVWTSLLNDSEPLNDTSCIPVTTTVVAGLAELPEKLTLGIHPNPFSDYTTLEIPPLTTEPARLRINDLTGRLIREEPIQKSGTYRLDRGNMVPGIYFIRLYINKDQYVEKLIVE